jgi:two-component system, chemotaxis family, CheB/CheR fusion protein
MSAKKTKGEKSPRLLNNSNDDPVAIVGIGASAGGLEAFTELIESLPGDTGMSFVFIMHLEPNHESKLSEIFSKHTSMPVLQVKGTTKIKSNHIYAIPPNKYLFLEDGKLELSERTKSEGIYLPIDYFFKSLAKVEKNRAIGIVLSGTASDGTEGLRMIKGEGGLTFAQDEASAKYTGMPMNAIDSGNVDIVLSPDQIGRELVRIASHPYIAFTSSKEKESEQKPEEEDSYTAIFRKLRTTTGVDFSNYKLNTIKRRITRRMVLNKTENLKHYVNIINVSNIEVYELYKDLLINVTSFFRDPEVFGMLKSKVFPQITKDISFEKPLRIWIPGCSSGEEVYSIVISLFEYLGNKIEAGTIQVFATDISDPAIDKARSGIYLETELKDIPEEIRRKYFVKHNGAYQVIKSIREVCIFARQDIAKDPPFSRIDFISCRNLLIYFSQELQKKVLPIFHYALKPDGFLLLGTSESVGGFGDLFYLNDRKFKLYNKRQTDHHIGVNFSYSYPERTQNQKLQNFNSDKIDIQKEADRLILSEYSPPGILINSSMDIIQFRGNISGYLDPSIGDASLNVFKMLKEILNLDLRSAIRRVKQTGENVTVEDIRFESDGSSGLLDIVVLPVRTSTGNDESYLILFREKEDGKNKKTGTQKTNKDRKNVISTNSESETDRIKKELILTKEHLQSIIEERDAANEELRSALEELQSSNEELQSTNEEMETAREELQSTNEELETVNDELSNRNDQLNIINNDLQNLISSLHIPIIMLDRDLKIRRYTPKAEKIWNLITSDIGRPIGNINPNIEIPEIKEHILEVLDNLETKEFQIKDKENNWYSVMIRPYRTEDNKIDGVVISLYNVDTLRRERDTALDGKNFANEVFSNVEGAIVILNDDLEIIDATRTFFDIFKIDAESTVGKSIFEIGNGKWNKDLLKKTIGNILPGKKELNNSRFKIDKKNLLMNSQVFRVPGKEKEYILLMIREED